MVEINTGLKYNMLVIKDKLKDGLTGVMRVHNEAALIEGCIDSCINALDELIVMCNDCTDETPQILARKQKEYPGKLRVYMYNHNVLSFELSPTEYEEAMNLPDESVRLYCNMCNYGLSQSHFKYVVKIDTDQLYFENELKKWRDLCANEKKVNWSINFVLGYFFMLYFSFYRRVSNKIGKPCYYLLPQWLINVCWPAYFNLAAWKMLRGKASVSLSGINVFKDDQWYIPFDTINAHPPYNGSGDTVIFKLSPQTFFTRYPNPKYLSVTESFTHPYKIMYAGPMWYHLHANRKQCFQKVKKVKDAHPEMFLSFGEFSRMSYPEFCTKMGGEKATLFSRILFVLIHGISRQQVVEKSSLLEKIKFK